MLPWDTVFQTVGITRHSVCGFGPRQSSALHGLDFGFFCAVVIPFADEAKLRLLCDWGNWVHFNHFPLFNLDIQLQLCADYICRYFPSMTVKTLIYNTISPMKKWLIPIAFDNGALKDDQVMAQRMIGDLISVMEGSLEEPEEPLLKAFQLTWKQISEVRIDLYNFVNSSQLMAKRHPKVW